MNVDLFKKQHEDLLNVIASIKGIVGEGNPERDAAILANLVNVLAGKLRVHLTTEDEFLYPSLLNNTSMELKKMAELYIKEMGSIGKVFTSFKDSYNTKTKILSDAAGFIKATANILDLLETRIEKENKRLYPLI